MLHCHQPAQSNFVPEPEDIGCLQHGSIVILLAEVAKTAEDVYTISAKTCERLMNTVKQLSALSSDVRLFGITQD